jgi:hypothetical protein
MNIRHLVAGAAIVFSALAAGAGVAAAEPGVTPSVPRPSIPSVSYVPKDNPATAVNEENTMQTVVTHDQANSVADMLSPLNPISPLGQQMRETNQNNDCLTINSSGPLNHAFTPNKVGPDGVCNQAVG